MAGPAIRDFPRRGHSGTDSHATGGRAGCPQDCLAGKMKEARSMKANTRTMALRGPPFRSLRSQLPERSYHARIGRAFDTGRCRPDPRGGRCTARESVLSGTLDTRGHLSHGRPRHPGSGGAISSRKPAATARERITLEWTKIDRN